MRSSRSLSVLADARVGVAARLEASFGAGRSGRNARVCASSPLELRGPFAGRGLPRFFLRNVTAGVFAGDRYDLMLRTEPGARAWVEPNSATRIHGGRAPGARSSLRIEAACSSTLVVSSGLTIPYADSCFTQVVDAVVHPGAALAYLEVTAVGRAASGERLAFGSYASEFRVRPGERSAPLYEERFVICPRETATALERALAGADALGSLFLLGKGQAGPAALDPSPDVYGGTTVLPNGAGLLVRALGGAEAVMSALDAVLVRWLV